MSFYSLNIPSILRKSKIFFIIMIISWLLIFLVALSEPFSLTKQQLSIITVIPAFIFVPIYIAGFISPLFTAIYGWILTFSKESKGVRIYGLVSAIAASALSSFIVIMAIS